METPRLGKPSTAGSLLCLWYEQSTSAMRKQTIPTNVPFIKGEMPESCLQEPLITSSHTKMTLGTLSHSGIRVTLLWKSPRFKIEPQHHKVWKPQCGIGI